MSYEPIVKTAIENVAKTIEDKVIDETVLTAKYELKINIDNEELAKALAYDRGQYEKGYADGVAGLKPKWRKGTDKEGLDEDVHVLLAYRWRYDYFWQYEIAWLHDGNWDTEDFSLDDDDGDIYWMPLPEPPEEE